MTIKNIDELSFEEAMGELEAIVRELEGGNSALEKSIERYERGTKLKEHCLGKLSDAKLRIDKIVKQGEQIKLENFAAE
jgi:exodeoxyribonuclease VII small subunit